MVALAVATGNFAELEGYSIYHIYAWRKIVHALLDLPEVEAGDHDKLREARSSTPLIILKPSNVLPVTQMRPPSQDELNLFLYFLVECKIDIQYLSRDPQDWTIAKRTWSGWISQQVHYALAWMGWGV